jgi:hypothetical protein
MLVKKVSHVLAERLALLSFNLRQVHASTRVPPWRPQSSF